MTTATMLPGAGTPPAPAPTRTGSVDVLESTDWRALRDRLFAFVQARVDEPAKAEDIVHDVLVRAFSRIDTLRDTDRIEAWLYQITRNALTDHFRGGRPVEPLSDQLPDDPVASASARAELARCVGPLIDGLPEHYAEALRLSEIQGLTQKETAERLGISVSGAKSRVQRGRRLLRDRLLACCRIELDTRGGMIDYEPRRDRPPEGD